MEDLDCKMSGVIGVAKDLMEMIVITTLAAAVKPKTIFSSLAIMEM